MRKSGQSQERQWKPLRDLSKTSGLNDDGKTLFFTSTTSTAMPLATGGSVAYTGLYKCNLDLNHEELENGVDLQQCSVAQTASRIAMSLHNLQFHNGDNETGKQKKKKNERRDSGPPSYLYANTKVEKRNDTGSWEILRAKLPVNRGDGLFEFESVFRTLEAFDWNECDFKCCHYISNTDDDPFEYSKEEENNYFAHTHAYVRAIPRSFSVDETTGDIFVSWEGFYQHCDPASPDQEKTLQWTIGISRLKTEDPYCITDQAYAKENNFARCTEPVSLVHQSSSGRDIILPYGGFTVIPARDEDHSRSFLLSALTHPDVRGESKNYLWSISEGENQSQELLSLNGEGTSMDRIDTDVWDGGTLRLHYNTKTGRPDYLCRSIFSKGIGCMPISEISNGDGSVDIQPQGEEEIVLTQEAFGAFCNIESQDKDFGKRKTYRSPVVAGLDIVWDENEEDGSGSPKQVVFGCFGEEGSNGNLGTIFVNHGVSTSPVQVIKGAYPGAVLFPPKELEDSLLPSMDFSDASTAPTFFQEYTYPSIYYE